MFLSAFDLFKIGIGPSSSHTMGPMVAAQLFLHEVRNGNWPRPAHAVVDRIGVSLHGSLAFTGKGHGSDRAIILGLMGEDPKSINPDDVENILETISKCRKLPGQPEFSFDPEQDLEFDYDTKLSGHSNGMIFYAYNDLGVTLLRKVYYSIGGGFVVEESQLEQATSTPDDMPTNVPFPFANAKEMLVMAKNSGRSIADMKRANEEIAIGHDALDKGLLNTWAAMNACVERGLTKDGILPGGLEVKRRAKCLHERLNQQWKSNHTNPLAANDWLSLYAIAVNEENAAGGKVVTAPTNGAAGVIPAVIRYYLGFSEGANIKGVEEFLLTAAAIGGLIKHNASISGAEVGCQGEVGSASAMAAAGLAAVMGGTPAQVENAAEIALEHHLGMTCDPVGGLVQVPCIERNALGAVKAVTAASLALHGDGTHFVSLDSCVETMRQTGLDMNERYKETSQGGLAVNTVEC
jgi:L-serine dehydratase